MNESRLVKLPKTVEAPKEAKDFRPIQVTTMVRKALNKAELVMQNTMEWQESGV